MSALSLGSWLTLGSRVVRESCREIVQRAYELGINLFDTADVYASGEAEIALGRALAAYPRHHLVIATKCFFPMSAQPNDRGLSRKHLFESVEGSLRRLGTDYLDLHQCHRFDPTTPLDETVRAYADLIRQGKLLYWGVSEWSAEQIEAACRSAERLGGPRPISNQPQYSILRRGIEGSVLPTCEREGLGQLVFSPLAQGVLSGKYSGGALPSESRGADPQRNRFMQELLEPSTLARVDALAPLARDLGLELPQLALAWCLRQTGVASVICGVTRVAQIEANARAVEIELPAEALRAIDAIAPAAAH